MWWTIGLVAALVVLLSRAARVRRVGVSHGEPARPPARALRPVLAGSRRGAGPPGRGGPRGRGATRSAGTPTLRPSELVARADAAESAPRQAREGCENKLAAALAMIDPASVPTGVIAELADAEARVVLARRFHNDAVRDTLALRERRLVRLFRLAGTAKLPTYFEIAERSHGAPSRRSSGRRPANLGAGGAARRDRRGVAVVRV